MKRNATFLDDDERLSIPNSAFAHLPYCTIGELDNGCSAVFIGPYHALTAASCVYNMATNTWRGNYDVIRRRNCNRTGTRMIGIACAVWSVQGIPQITYHNTIMHWSSPAVHGDHLAGLALGMLLRGQTGDLIWLGIQQISMPPLVVSTTLPIHLAAISHRQLTVEKLSHIDAMPWAHMVLLSWVKLEIRLVRI